MVCFIVIDGYLSRFLWQSHEQRIEQTPTWALTSIRFDIRGQDGLANLTHSKIELVKIQSWYNIAVTKVIILANLLYITLWYVFVKWHLFQFSISGFDLYLWLLYSFSSWLMTFLKPIFCLCFFYGKWQDRFSLCWLCQIRSPRKMKTLYTKQL